jgi:ATP-dependent HslUV protease, peptidase subunit HslV
MSDTDDKARHGLAPWHGTTILLVRKGSDVVLAGDGQVSVGNTVMKSNARKLRRISKGDGRGQTGAYEVIAGFAGSTADALTLFERLEGKLAVADKQTSFVLTGSGDVLEPEDGLIGIGSGGSFALAAARALIDVDGMSAEAIAKKAMKIAADICIYTNHNVIFEKL